MRIHHHPEAQREFVRWHDSVRSMRSRTVCGVGMSTAPPPTAEVRSVGQVVDYPTFNGDRTRYEYLPAIVMHEFGHAIGLAHGGTGIMVWPHDDQSISSDDESAAQAIYQPHIAH